MLDHQLQAGRLQQQLTTNEGNAHPSLHFHDNRYEYNTKDDDICLHPSVDDHQGGDDGTTTNHNGNQNGPYRGTSVDDVTDEGCTIHDQNNLKWYSVMIR